MAKKIEIKVSNYEAGSDFEKYVENIYKNLGYATERNVTIGGQQIDIVATKEIEGIGATRIVIECKFLSQGAIDNQTVFDFLNVFRAIQMNMPFYRGIIITNQSFTRPAKLAAGESILLMTVHELEDSLMNFKKGYLSNIKSFEAMPIFNQYIPLIGSDITNESKSALLENVELHIIDLITGKNGSNTNQPVFITLLGDYGTGKSTSVKKIFYELCKLNLSGKITQRPIYIELKHYHLFRDLIELIEDHIKKVYGIRILPEDLIKEIQRGAFIFLLDGFDEMSRKVDQKVRLENFTHLSLIFKSACSSVLTSRPSYFVSASEYFRYISLLYNSSESRVFSRKGRRDDINGLRTEAMALYQSVRDQFIEGRQQNTIMSKIIVLSKLSSNQIDRYLERLDASFLKSCGVGWKEVKGFLQDIYDLSDLISKPILLSISTALIIKDGRKFKDTTSISFTPSTLYEMYTSMKFDIDWAKGKTRHFLTPDQRQEFAEAIAVKMLYADDLYVSYKDISSIVEQKRALWQKKDMVSSSFSVENVISDIQICTFITRDSSDNFEFAHTSFMEFFVARFLKNNLGLNGDADFFETRNLSSSILMFMGSFIAGENSLRKTIETLYKDSIVKDPRSFSKIFKRNIVLVVLYSSNTQHLMKIFGVVVDKFELRNVKFTFPSFADSKFQNVTFRTCTLTSPAFKNFTFEDSELINFETLDGVGDIRIKNCKLEKFSLRTANNGGQLSLALNGPNVARNLDIQGVVCTCFGSLALSSARFEKVIFASRGDSYSVTGEKISFLDCQLFDMLIASPFTFGVEEVEFNIRFDNCRGVVAAQLDVDEWQASWRNFIREVGYVLYARQFQRIDKIEYVIQLGDLFIVDSSNVLNPLRTNISQVVALTNGWKIKTD